MRPKRSNNSIQTKSKSKSKSCVDQKFSQILVGRQKNPFRHKDIRNQSYQQYWKKQISKNPKEQKKILFFQDNFSRQTGQQLKKQKKPRSKRSWVWGYIYSFQDGVKCKLCGTFLKYHHRSLSIASNHLQQCHYEAVKQSIQSSPEHGILYQLNKYAAQYLLNHHQIANICSQIGIYQKYGLDRHKISTLVRDVNVQFQKTLAQYLLNHHSSDYYVLSIDRCQSQSRRFINILVYIKNKPFNLGILRQKCSNNPQQTVKILRLHLNKFNLKSQYMKAMISYSGSNNNNKNIARILGIPHISCLCNMVHKITRKFLCAPRQKTTSKTQQTFQSASQSQQQHQSTQSLQSDIEERQYQIKEQQTLLQIVQIINKIRNISKKFKKSSSLCEQYINFTRYKYINLSLDVATRWWTTCRMLKDYIQNHYSLVSFFKQKKIVSYISEEQLKKIVAVQQILEFAYQATLHFQSNQTNIYNAQRMIYTWVDQLSKISNPFADKYKNNLIETYTRQRNVQFLSLGFFLINKQEFNHFKQRQILPYLSELQIQQFTKNIFYTQIYSQQIMKQISSHPQDSQMNQPQFIRKHKKTFQIKQQLFIKKLNQFEAYCLSNKKNKYLVQLQKFCLRILCHSVQNQRGFSNVNRILKIDRPQLTDNSICALYFSRWYWLLGGILIDDYRFRQIQQKKPQLPTKKYSK